MSRVRIPFFAPFPAAPIVYRLGHQVLILESGVRFPVGVPLHGIMKEYAAPTDLPAVRADVWLAAASNGEFSRSRVKSLIEAGFVTRNGEPLGSASTFVRAGDVLAVNAPEEPRKALEAQDIPLTVVYEDADIIVVDKPAGLVVHPAAGHPDGTLVNALLHHSPDFFSINTEKRPGIVHRLDQYTSGVMVAAKNDRAMASLSAAFQNGLVHKTYMAIAHGAPFPEAGRIETLIGRDPRNRQKMAVVERNGKIAITNYQVAENFGASALLEVRIETGRTHQIRVHCASIGHPLAGDAVYGKKKLDVLLPLAPARQMLHAFRLALPHPSSGEQLAFEAPLPADFAEVLNSLRKQT